MFLSLQQRSDLGLSEPEVVDVETNILPNGITCTKESRIQKVRPKDLENSFTFNTEKESQLLKYIERFVVAFEGSHPGRTKLFLGPYNECGIPKFVNTTIRPTKLRQLEMYHAKTCAEFVAGFLSFEPLKYATIAPKYLPSPKAVLKWQIGDPFDFATVLTSFLIGAGYDAYVVKGYAPKAVTWRDQSKTQCPALDESTNKSSAAPGGAAAPFAKAVMRDGKNGTEDNEEKLEYPMQRPSVGVSKYEKMMQERADEVERKKAEAEAALLHEEEPEEPVDPLDGKRVHAWVLIVPNGRTDIKEYVMIESTTGVIYPLLEAPYYGVEQAWNHTNHFINMQDTSAPARSLQWDLGEIDSPNWLPIFDTDDLNSTSHDHDSDGEDTDTDADVKQGSPTSPRSPRSPRSPHLSSGDLGSQLEASLANSKPGSPKSATPGLDNSQNAGNKDSPKTAEKGSAKGAANPAGEASKGPAVGSNDEPLVPAIAEDLRPSAASSIDLHLANSSQMLPPPWCSFLQIPISAFNARYGGKKHEKVVLYKRAKHEMFAKHAHSEGLTSRVTIYNDDEYTIPVETREEFCSRTDKLSSRVRKPLEGLTISFFDPGRPRKLRELHEVMGRSLTMIFDSEARLDGLQRREEVFGESLSEHFNGRSDRLVNRSISMVANESNDDVDGNETSNTNGSASTGGTSLPHAFTIPGGPTGDFLIESMVQEFGTLETKEAVQCLKLTIKKICGTTAMPSLTDNDCIFCMVFASDRDESKEAAKDVAKRVYMLLPHHKQKITEYKHFGKYRIMQESQEFLKVNAPQHAFVGATNSVHDSSGANSGLGGRGDYHENMGNGLLRVLQLERECYQSIRESKREIELILRARQDEEANINLKKTIFESVRENEGKTQGDTQEEPEEETTTESDYLTPFLPKGVKLAPITEDGSSNGENTGRQLTKEQAQKVADNCLNALKKRLVERASIIQRRLDSENEKLSKRQALFQRSRDASESVDDEYEKFCQEAMFRIQILEKRFQKHEETAFQKYEDMIARLDADVRLAAKNQT